MAINLDIVIGTERIAPERVEEWERRSALRALRKLGARPEGGDLAALREQVMARKVALGHDAIRARLCRDLAVSDILGRAMARLSRGRRRFSVIDILSSEGSAEGFARWFEDVARRDREDVMIAAAPEHYLIATDAAGRQEVIETNGGAPAPARFLIDYADLSSLRSKADPAFPVQVAGVARASRGTAIGGVRHQFRDEGPGFRARLTVEFPWFIMSSVIRGHRWHLACEFSHWIRTYVAETRSAPPGG